MIIGVDVNLRVVTACRMIQWGVELVEWTVPFGTRSLDCPRKMFEQITADPGIVAGDVVWVERPMGRHIKSVADLSRVMGAFLATLPSETSVEEVTAPEWKRIIGLSGNAGKAEVRGWMADEWRHRCLQDLGYVATEHEVDAFAIAVACERESQRATEQEGKSLA